MSSGEVVGIISVSLTGVAAVWLLSYFVRPFLDWWYRDIDTFESLLPTVDEMQGIRAGQITNRYRPFVHADDEHDYQHEEYSVTGCGTDFLQWKWAEMDRAAGEVAA